MENFWKWLLKANARGVLGSAVLALVLMTGWWTWRELSPANRGEQLASVPPKEKLRDSLGLIEHFGDPGNTNAIVLPENPFLVAWNMPKTPYVPKPRTKTDGTSVAVTPKTGPRTPVKPVRPRTGKPVAKPAPGDPPVAPAVPERPKFEMITLTYKGILTRTDGTSLALIEDTKGNATRFYHQGRSLYGLKVESIDTTSVSITGVDGKTVTVKIQDPKVIKIPLQ